MPYQWDFHTLWQYRTLFLTGVVYTVLFTLVTAVAGLILGLLLALGRMGRHRVLALPLAAFVELFRCTPVLVQLIWCYYALPVLLDVSLSPSAAAALTLSCYGAAFYAEIIRGGIVSIDAGQWDAGRALGLARWPLMRRVILPQATRRMVPPLVNQLVLQLKNTALVSVLAVPDLLYQGQMITSASYRPLEVYTLTGLLYFALLFPLTRFAMALERRWQTARTTPG